MNDLLIKVSVGELLDKITILKIKQERISDQIKLQNINTELDHLHAVMEQLNLDGHSLKKMEELRQVNEDLWQVEDQLRELERLGSFGEDFIFLARSVYMKNDLRSKLKKELNIHLGSALIEEKSYSDYQNQEHRTQQDVSEIRY